MDIKDDEEILRNFGLNVRYEREKRKLKQEELAEILDCSAVYVSNIENGKHKISLTNALKFSRYFNRNIEELVIEK